MKKNQMLMTSGTIWKQMLLFAFPVFLGNLFQQLYNTADSLIVGNYLGSSSLAAVTSCGELIFLLTSLFQGISVGAGVVIARYFGRPSTSWPTRSASWASSSPLRSRNRATANISSSAANAAGGRRSAPT